MDFSIIIVSWNVREHLAQCLASIERLAEEAGKGLSFEVFVVDNVSMDGTRDWLLNYESGIKNNEHHLLHNSLFIIHNSTNTGFAAANNQAIRKARGEFILLLNPDTELHTSPGDVVIHHPVMYGMLHFMDSHPRCGIAGPMLRNADGTLQPSVRRFPRAWDPILFSLGVTPKKYCMTDFDYTRESQVDQVMGACFLIRRKCLEAIGLLDERFFIWFEEVDYCRRAKNSGWEVWYTPDAALLHHGGESFAKMLTLKKQWIYSQSLLRYFAKYHAWGAWALNALLVIPRLCIALFYRHAHHRS